jgi:hypothetical protein
MSLRSTKVNSTFTAVTPVISAPTAVTLMIFCNLQPLNPLDPTSGEQYVSVRVGPAGVADASDTYTILNEVKIDPSDTLTFDTERLILDAGDAIYVATSSPNELTVTLSYVSI